MFVKRYVLASVFTLCFFPLLTRADINVQNNTTHHATAKTSYSPCSSVAGDGGIINPGASMNIPQWVLNTYCFMGCNADVYISKNCSGKSIATLKLDPGKGILQVNNHNIDGFVVSGVGKVAAINGGPN